MVLFVVRFLVCNLLIIGIIGTILIVKKIFQRYLSGRMQYHLWYILLGLLVVPFIPFRLTKIPELFLWVQDLKNGSTITQGLPVPQGINVGFAESSNWMKEYTISVDTASFSTLGTMLFGIWILGIVYMILLNIKSVLHLRKIKNSALLLENPEIYNLYRHCLKELKIQKNIPVYSTVCLNSPVIVGLLKPRIYLPLHLISDYNPSDMRYILLHELQHYKHKDSIATYFMIVAKVFYWFNPLVWYALKEMGNDREIACDTSVLNMLSSDSYVDYANTLINYAEKIALSPFPMVSGLLRDKKQIERRILSIVSYQKPTFWKKTKGLTAFLLTVTLLAGFVPLLSAYAIDEQYYLWQTASENIQLLDLSEYFDEYNGSFVLYDLENDTWNIHNMDLATFRTSPNSTYKVYSALFGLEEGIITAENSFMKWDKTEYPFEEWNADQTLQSAMQSSVNWYFQSIEQQLGIPATNSYLNKIGYGNKNTGRDVSAYWMESSLKISAVEQVELLKWMYLNRFDFSSENIETVKDSIRLYTSKDKSIYGKTGTGRVNEQDVNGWFIGFAEHSGHTYFFATNIGADGNATGSRASEITLSILSDLNIWNE